MTTGTFTGVDPAVERSKIADMRSAADCLESAADSHNCPSNDETGSHNGCGARLAEMRAQADALRREADRRTIWLADVERCAHTGWNLNMKDWYTISGQLPPEYQYLGKALCDGKFVVVGNTPQERAKSYTVAAAVLADLLPDNQIAVIRHQSGAVTVVAPGVAPEGKTVRNPLYGIAAGAEAIHNEYPDSIMNALRSNGVDPKAPVTLFGHSQGAMSAGDILQSSNFPYNVKMTVNLGYFGMRPELFNRDSTNYLINNTNDSVVQAERLGFGISNLGYGINHTATGLAKLAFGDIDAGLRELRLASASFESLFLPTEPGVTVHENLTTANVEGPSLGTWVGHELPNYILMLESEDLGTPEANEMIRQLRQTADDLGVNTSGTTRAFTLPELS